MAVFAPTPSASVNTATAVNPGLFNSDRRPTEILEEAIHCVARDGSRKGRGSLGTRAKAARFARGRG